MLALDIHLNISTSNLILDLMPCGFHWIIADFAQLTLDTTLQDNPATRPMVVQAIYIMGEEKQVGS